MSHVKKWRETRENDVFLRENKRSVLQQFGDFVRERAVVVDADELEVGFIDGFVVAAEAVVVAAIGEFIVG